MFGYVTGFDSCHLGRSHIQLHCCKQMSSLCICKKQRLWGPRAWCNARIGRFSFKY